MAGVTAIVQLLRAGAHPEMASRFMVNIKVMMEQAEPLILPIAAEALGLLARISSAVTHNFVEQQLAAALEWLSMSAESRRHLAAVLMLKELALNAPTIFHGQVSSFLTKIWGGLKDESRETRLVAADALGACLQLLGQRPDQQMRGSRTINSPHSCFGTDG